MATFKEICRSCRYGFLPVVKHKPTGRKGIVTMIKQVKDENADTHRKRGIAVNYGESYDEWYWDDNSSDKRIKYLREIEIIQYNGPGSR
ncbi:hypothetical protein D3C72_700810 [compost metagenome]